MATITTIDPSKKDDKKKLKVAAYCRVSTGTAEQEESLTAQREHYEGYIKSNPDWQFAGLYYDEAVSGTSTERREALAKMLEDARQGKIDFILTKSISRFSRNKIDCLNMTRELSACGVGIYSEKEGINTLDANGEDGKLKIVPEEAEVVKRIYREYLEGGSTISIAKGLEEDGIKNGCGRTKWYGTTVQKILSNEKYIGDALLQKTVTIDTLQKKRVKNVDHQYQYYVKDEREGGVWRMRSAISKNALGFENWKSAGVEMQIALAEWQKGLPCQNGV